MVSVEWVSRSAALTDIDAVERYSPYGWEVDITLVNRFLERHNLLVTGRSDADDTTLGYAVFS